MKRSKVYFVAVSQDDPIADISVRLGNVLEKSAIFGLLNRDDRVAVKLHFGEEGNVGHVLPAYVKVICDAIKARAAIPFLSDANTLYKGRRTDSREHAKLALEHGFTKSACGAGLVIPDDNKEDAVADIQINGKYFKTAKVMRVYIEADMLVGVAHFKGHIMTGFGGALKNIGMGCASRAGKLAQHSELVPIIDTKQCVCCMLCAKSCPVEAISEKGGAAAIDPAKCIGCATCIAVCPHHAIDVPWESGGSKIQQKMIEYTAAVLRNAKKCAYINFATKITRECDCLAKDDPRIAPDVGIFVSDDPVAVDMASYDAVVKVCKKDIFRVVHPDRDSMIQIREAERLGLGSREYELISL